MISLNLDPRSAKLRAEFLLWLSANPPPQLKARPTLEQFVEVSRAWQARLARERWVGVHFPEQYGGRGLSIIDEAIIQECLALHSSPQLINLFGLTMVGPVLIAHGTEEQKQRFLPSILSASEIWCQGFSEPQAGSDLASLKTTAMKQADGSWKLQGQKVWTSFAHVADWCFVLARTDASAERHKGLSYLLLPMRGEGITVRSLTQISGDKEFNELFLDGASTAAENIVGAEGEGWKIAISTLMYERVVLTFARHLQSENLLQSLAQTLKNKAAKGEIKDAQLVKFGRLLARSHALRALALSHLQQYTGAESRRPGPEGSLDKLAWSECFQDICKFALELSGEDAILSGGLEAVQDGRFIHEYLYSRGRSIAAGTSEIQRNIIAERLLGLPKE